MREIDAIITYYCTGKRVLYLHFMFSLVCLVSIMSILNWVSTNFAEHLTYVRSFCWIWSSDCCCCYTFHITAWQSSRRARLRTRQRAKSNISNGVGLANKETLSPSSSLFPDFHERPARPLPWQMLSLPLVFSTDDVKLLLSSVTVFFSLGYFWWMEETLSTTTNRKNKGRKNKTKNGLSKSYFFF